MSHRRMPLALIAAAVMVLALVAAGPASAYSASEKASERKQNTRIKSALRGVSAQKLVNDSQTTQLTSIETLAKSVDARLKVIEGAAPAIIDGLTQLKDAATQLKTGLETAGAGLTKLGDAYQAVEYGRASLFYTNGTAVAGTAMTSADIPDDGNTVSVVDDAIVAIPTTAATTINLRAAIRSAEEDGDSASDTAGQAGGFIQVYNANTGAPIPCAGSTAPLGIFGTVPGDSIVTPSGTVTNLPLKNIPGGNLRTDTTHPDGTSTSLLPAACTIAGATAGDIYKVHYSVNFVDIPTSTSPGPKD